jgi:uncharacterized protein YcaQ
MTRIPVETVRRLLLGGQGLSEDPSGVDDLRALILRLGFVQVDTINVVEKAQHLTLATRMDGYRPAMLRALVEEERGLFEHWTHDASLIPVEFFPLWRHRFERYAKKVDRSAWWRASLGEDGDAVIAHVEQRIRAEGPLASGDFEGGGASAGWWSWKPQKSALEYLWRRGTLAVAHRRGFQKVYDLTERVLPEAVRKPAPSRKALIEWACGGALERLGVATPSEIAAYWNMVEGEQARAWCAAAAKEGRIAAVRAEDVDGNARPAFAVANWSERAAEPPAAVRLLCPFDPLIRDRKRLERFFGFHYRFEAFVPPPQREFGYYVMPVLEGDRFVARVDLKNHRRESTLEVRGLWWERGVRVGVRRRRALQEALERMARFLGAARVRGPG